MQNNQNFSEKKQIMMLLEKQIKNGNSCFKSPLQRCIFPLLNTVFTTIHYTLYTVFRKGENSKLSWNQARVTNIPRFNDLE